MTLTAQAMMLLDATRLMDSIRVKAALKMLNVVASKISRSVIKHSKDVSNVKKAFTALIRYFPIVAPPKDVAYPVLQAITANS